MPDGRRKRRFSVNAARRRWYAEHRSRRFCRRFGWFALTGATSSRFLSLATCLESESGS